MRQSIPLATIALLLLLLPPFARSAAAPSPAAAPVSAALSAEAFNYSGDWTARSDLKQLALVADPRQAGSPAGGYPAVAAVSIAAPGRYRLWVRTRDFPDDRPGTRTFAVAIGGKRADKTFGASGKAGYAWEDGGWFDLQPGPALIRLLDARPYARFAGLLLTTDAAWVPTLPLKAGASRSVAEPRVVQPTTAAAPARVRITSQTPEAELTSGDMRLQFLPADRASAGETEPTVAVRALLKSGDRWIDAGADPDAEGYFAVLAGAQARLSHNGFYPAWPRGADLAPVELEAGGVTVRTIAPRQTGALWQAGALNRFIPRVAIQRGEAVRIEFRDSPAGKLQADWAPGSDGASASVSLSFTPAADGQSALGYTMFFRKPRAQVRELLLPMMWQRLRLPTRPTTLLDNCTPTPIALAEPRSAEPDAPRRCFAIVGEPADAPFAWPDGRDVHFGLSIADDAGQVQPSIWGPVIGAPGGGAVARAGVEQRLRFRTLVCPGDWYAGYRIAADRIDSLRDYRRNDRTSLTDAALNMIDLTMDDAHGGWWPRAKAFYQIESKNGATEAAPMTLLSLYRLTGDDRIYRERALPTIEFMLSRDGPHFSPLPADTGPYPAGSMAGPSKLFGSIAYCGLWELTGRRTPALAQIGMPGVGVRPTSGYAHLQPFDDWLARYEASGDARDLDRACALADKYIAAAIDTAPTRDLGPQPFFYISFVPDWEGLLRLYEASGRQRYLDAAAFGARQLMTGVWTQPIIPPGEVVIHPGNQFIGDATHEWYRGAERFRLGWPPAPGAIVQHGVPAWLVSNVGLGFEQPITFDPAGPARQIYEEAWAPHFLRLYRYTHDPAFLTYARNATVGRWGNYPGYYAVGQTDLPENPNYPLTGPDVTDFYYHHIPAHLAWTIDYLVTEAETLSDGKISFPSLRQAGYAYFDSRVFGQAPGKVYDDPSAWLLLRRGIASLDNVQVNYLLARGEGALHVILTNQSPEPQRVNVKLALADLGLDAGKSIAGSLRIGASESAAEEIANGSAAVALPARGLAVLTVPGARLDVPAQRVAEAPPPASADAIVSVRDAVAETRAAAIHVLPGGWDAYVWSTASPAEAKSAVLHYAIGDGAWKSADCAEYPFEFSIHVEPGAGRGPFRFHLDLTRSSGETARGPQATLDGG